jgi:hypothetical protein
VSGQLTTGLCVCVYVRFICTTFESEGDCLLGFIIWLFVFFLISVRRLDFIWVTLLKVHRLLLCKHKPTATVYQCSQSSPFLSPAFVKSLLGLLAPAGR